MWTGLTDSPGVTIELGEPGMIGVVTVPGLPSVVGATGHVQSTLVGRPVTAESTLS